MNNGLHVSSGDLIADRRYATARELAGRGDFSAAADLFEQALERAPCFAAGWFALGEIREKRGDTPGAVAAFRRSLALGAQDRQGAALRLARLEGRIEPMPAAYVRALFDQYAPRYDRALVQELGYCAPNLLRDGVEAVQRARARPLRFRRALDLGCGTGLAGEAFRACCAAMFGIDLSAAMIDAARRKQIYADLRVADLIEGLEKEDQPADLVIAADTFVYLADLGPVCRAVARVLETGGLFAFTLETHAGSGVMLGEKLRFAHSADHVRIALEAAGLKLLTLTPASVRTENAVPVAGLVAIAERA